MTSPAAESFAIHSLGQWSVGQIEIASVESSRIIVPAVEVTIDRAWHDARARLGEKLFDGPMCRLESWTSDRDVLRLWLSTTSYRVFLGTSLTGRASDLASQHGENVLARPIGASAALISADGHLLLGRRNDSVAYYPQRLHPFAGSLEPRAEGMIDVFDEVRRELREELSLESDDVSQIVCTGIVEDSTLRHPEMIFTARASLPLERLMSQVHGDEHHESWSVPATPDAIAGALADRRLPFTPVALATMLLFGRNEFGADWFVEQRGRMC